MVSEVQPPIKKK
jgi:predicted Zn-dependent protease